MRLLDLYCKAGGAGEGYHRAGFEVVGVDIEPQKRYPHKFHQADAIEYLMEHYREFDAVHASPPCQGYCALKHLSTKEHVMLLPHTRDALDLTGLPYVIENTPGAPIRATMMLCGTMFGLKTPCGAEVQRHRYFETNWPLSCFVPQLQSRRRCD